MELNDSASIKAWRAAVAAGFHVERLGSSALSVRRLAQVGVTELALARVRKTDGPEEQVQRLDVEHGISGWC